jgi:hypothetical protein
VSIFEESNWTARADVDPRPGDELKEELLEEGDLRTVGVRGDGEGEVLGMNFGVVVGEEVTAVISPRRLLVRSGYGIVRLLEGSETTAEKF